MKSLIHNSTFYYGAVLLLVLSVFSSCKKDKNDSIPSGETELVFSVAGVQNPAENIIKFGSTGNGSTDGTENEKGPYTKLYDLSAENEGGIMVQTTSETSSFAAIAGSGRSAANFASVSPIGPNIAFKLIIYDQAGNYVTSAVGTSNERISLMVPAGVVYKWVAISFNDTDAAPLRLIGNNATLIPSSTTYDLLHTSGTTPNIAEGSSNAISITFDHKVALLEASIDVSAFSGTVTFNDIQAKFASKDYINSGIFNFKTGTYEVGSIESAGVENIHFQADPTNPKRFYISYYTADPTNLSTVGVQFDKFDALPQGATVKKSLLTSPNSIANPIEFQFNAPAIGQKLSGTMRVLSVLPGLKILHGDESDLYAFILGGAGTPWSYLPSNFEPPGGYEQGNAFNVATWKGFTGFLRRNFTVVRGAPISNANQYYPYEAGKGQIPVKTGILSDRADGGGQFRAKLYDTFRPDVTIIRSATSIKATPDDNIALEEYARAGGVVILFMSQGDNSTDEWYPFINSIFREPGKQVGIKRIAYGGKTAVGAPLAKAVATFKINANVNDPITNGYFGDVRNKYWGSLAYTTNSTYVEDQNVFTGIDASQIINYSANISSIAGNDNSQVPADSYIMFRHKTLKVFVVGEKRFAMGYYTAGGNVYNTGNYALDANFWPKDVNAYNTSYPNANSTIVGNLMVWALTDALYNKGVNHK